MTRALREYKKIIWSTGLEVRRVDEGGKHTAIVVASPDGREMTMHCGRGTFRDAPGHRQNLVNQLTRFKEAR